MIPVHYIWLIGALILGAIELISPGLFFYLSFSAGCVVTAIASIWLPDMSTQLNTFFASSLAAFLLLNYWVKSRQAAFIPAAETNMDALKGKTAYISAELTGSNAGNIKIDGDTWTARTLDQKKLSKGDLVEVVGSKGCHVLVRHINLADKPQNHKSA